MPDAIFAPLLPPGLHSLTRGELLRLCVEAFPESATRSRINSNIGFILDKLTQRGVTGEVWVNGSFVTDKGDPADADLLFLIPEAQYEQGTAGQKEAIEWINDNLRGVLLCDTYYLPVVTPDSPIYVNYQARLAYWGDHFGSDREGNPKGVAVLKIGERPMNAFIRHRELLRNTLEQVADIERLIVQYPERKSLLLERRSFQKVREQLESERVTITGRLIATGAAHDEFRLEMEDGAILTGKVSEKEVVSV